MHGRSASPNALNDGWDCGPHLPTDFNAKKFVSGFPERGLSSADVSEILPEDGGPDQIDPGPGRPVRPLPTGRGPDPPLRLARLPVVKPEPKQGECSRKRKAPPEKPLPDPLNAMDLPREDWPELYKAHALYNKRKQYTQRVKRTGETPREETIRKNEESKNSTDRGVQKEVEMADKTAELQVENVQLKKQIVSARTVRKREEGDLAEQTMAARKQHQKVVAYGVHLDQLTAGCQRETAKRLLEASYSLQFKEDPGN